MGKTLIKLNTIGVVEKINIKVNWHMVEKYVCSEKENLCLVSPFQKKK